MWNRKEEGIREICRIAGPAVFLVLMTDLYVEFDERKKGKESFLLSYLDFGTDTSNYARSNGFEINNNGMQWRVYR